MSAMEVLKMGVLGEPGDRIGEGPIRTKSHPYDDTSIFDNFRLI